MKSQKCSSDKSTEIKTVIKESIVVKLLLLDAQVKQIAKATDIIIGCLKKGGKVILFGNGGSAADSQHIAAELIGRFKKERPAIAAIALSVNTSILTAIGNDYDFSQIFSRQVEGIARKNDVAIGISTSGNSKNVIEAVKKANRMGLKTIALSGQRGCKLDKIAKVSINVPSKNTPRVQEAHITIGHIIAKLVEDAFTKN